MATREYNMTKNVSNDRILVLEKIEGQTTKNSAGVTDNRLFTGDNKFHAIKDPVTNFWKLQMDKGLLSESLKQQWTTFGKLEKYLSEYLKRRGIIVKEIIDA